MRLSNKSTFSLACLVLLLALVQYLRWLHTMSAEWSTDVDRSTAHGYCTGVFGYAYV